MQKKVMSKEIINWITVIIWGWFLLSFWTILPIPKFPIHNEAITAFIILTLQCMVNINYRDTIRLKNSETNLVAAIGVITLLCMFLVNSHLGAFFTVMNFCLLLFLCDKWRWNKPQICCVVTCCIAIFLSWILKPSLWGEGTNPNMIGTVTTFSMLVIISALEYLVPKKKWSKTLQLLLIAISFYQVITHHGRGTLLGLLFYCFLRFFFSKFWNRKKITYTGIFYLVTLGSVLFSALYTLSWHLTKADTALSLFGKRIFSGREVIWNEFWQRFLQKPLTGTGTNFVVESYFEFNVHNAMFDILAVHGVIVFGLVVYYIIKKTNSLYENYRQVYVFIPIICGMLAVFAESFTDMDLLWTPQFMVWSVMLLLLNPAKDVE